MAVTTFWSALILIINIGIVTGMNNSDDLIDYSIYEGLDPIIDLPVLRNSGIGVSLSKNVTAPIILTGRNPENLSEEELERKFANIKGEYKWIATAGLSDTELLNMCKKLWCEPNESGFFLNCFFERITKNCKNKFTVHFHNTSFPIVVDIVKCDCFNTDKYKPLRKPTFYVYRHADALCIYYYIFNQHLKYKVLHVADLYVDTV